MIRGPVPLLMAAALATAGCSGKSGDATVADATSADINATEAAAIADVDAAAAAAGNRTDNAADAGGNALDNAGEALDNLQ